MTNFKIKIVILLVLLLTVFTIVKAQDAKEEPIKVNTYLVNIPVIASDKEGRYIAGLTKENFTIMQDGIKQEIEYFASAEAPMNVAILIDASFSTKPFFLDINDAAKDFVDVFRPEDKGLIVVFNTYFKILAPLTSDKKELKKAISRSGGTLGGSNMQDALYHVVHNEFASVPGRKAVIVLTDGEVSGMSISNEKLLRALAASDALVYPIIFTNQTLPSKPKTRKKWKIDTGEIISDEEFQKRMEAARQQYLKFMNSLGLITGGMLFDSNDFRKSFQSIADELRKQYVVGFYPQSVDNGKSHQVMVEVNPSNILIRTKRNIQLKVSQ